MRGAKVAGKKRSTEERLPSRSFSHRFISSFATPFSPPRPQHHQQERQAEWLLRDFDAAGAVPVSVLLNYLRAELAVRVWFFLRFDFFSPTATTTTRTGDDDLPLFLLTFSLFPRPPPPSPPFPPPNRTEHRRGRGRTHPVLHLWEQRRRRSSRKGPPLPWRGAAPLWRAAGGRVSSTPSSVDDAAAAGTRSPIQPAAAPAAAIAAAADTGFRGRRGS